MRTLLFVAAMLMADMMTMSAAKKQVIDRIEPTDWYVGLKNPSVQLMVYGPGIRDVADVTTDYPGVRIDSLVRLDSPNYLFIYMNVRDAQPGTMTLTFKGGKVKSRKGENVLFQLKQREMSGDKRMGFTNADVLYMLMPDRFAQGANHNPQVAGMRPYKEDRTKPSLRHGGDLNGIREHLDYFNELGVTALWLTPVLENDSPDQENGFSTYHGYATTNYYRVDPRFGTNDDYKRLCDEAHAKGLKVVMDMIFNHSGFEHPWTHDMPSKDWLNVPEWLNEKQSGRDPMTGFTANADGSEPAKSAYLQTSYKLTPVLDPYASKVDLKETTEGWFVPSMPDLNQHNPHLMRYLIQNSIWWIETVGIDGIRMDTYPYAYAEAMAQWMKELDAEYPNFNTVGETWVTEPAYTAAWQKDSKLSNHNTYLKTVMDFSFFDKLNQAKNEETDGWWNGLNRLYNSFVYDYLYPNPSNGTGVATICQTIAALPKGKYQLQASIRSAYANQATSSYGLVAPGSSTSTTFTQGSQGCMTSMKWEVKTVNFEQMADGTATIGFDITWQSGGSCILFDDVRLYLLSDDYIEPDPSETSPTEGRVLTDFVGEADMKADLLQMLANFAAYMKNDFQDCQWPNSIDEVCGCFRGENTMGNDERGVRPNADLSMICAFLVKYAKGKVVLPTGVTWDDLELMAMKSLVFAYSTHKANKLKVCSGGNYWGSVSNADHVWESSLWAMSVAYSAFFQWEKLSDAQRNYIYQLLKSECNYELERSIPTGYAGDTKAEENGWEADILAATLGMFPDDPLAPRWFQRLREFAVNSYSQKDDAQDNTIIDPEYDQKTVSDLYKGKNLYDDFTLQNHNYFHTSYQNVVVQELGEAALALKLFQKGLSGTEQWRTNALMHNNQKVMDEVLYWLALADGELAMPNGNDWSLFLYDQITSYSTNACFLRDPHALMLENLAYKMIKARQTTTADGSWLLRPDVGARRMGVEAHRVMMTWLMHEMLPTADMAATTWEDFNRQYAQAKVFSSQNIVRAATDSRFTCFSWSTGLNSYTGYIAANSVDKNKIVVPFRANNTGNFLGWYEVQSKSTNATPMEQQDENGQRSMYNVQCIGNSFVMNGELQTNDAALNNRFALYSTPGNVVIYLDYVRANQNATITAEKGGLMAISVDELTKTSRKFFTEESDAEGGRITSKQLDGSVFTKLPASWVNIDNELGIITSTQQMAFGDKANNNSINTAKLYTLYSDQSRQVKTGDIVGSRYAFYYSKVTAQQTMELNEQGGGLKAEEGWNAALAFDPDQTGYLLLCNFCGDEACTLNNILTHKGAPVFTARTRIGSAGSTATFEATLNHSVANTLKFFIAGTGLDAIQEKGDSTAIYLLNNVKGKNAITINASDQSQSMSKDVTLFNMVLKAYILDGELIVEEADYFPGEEQPDGIMAMDDGQWTLDDEGGDIYDLSGRRITNSEFTIQNSKLPRGIYIVGGKKKKIQGLP